MTTAFLGPAGTFTEEALLSDPACNPGGNEPRALATIQEVLLAVQNGEVDHGFVAMENSIEGTVNVTLDTLVFGAPLLIQREILTPIRMNLLGVSGADLGGVGSVVSFPHALAQCRDWLSRELPEAEVVAANSTAEAAASVAHDQDPSAAAIGTTRAAEIHGLDVLAAGIEDHPDNSTRFVLVAREGIPPPTGHDKTSIVCFQGDDHPGSLHSILGQFTARDINLTKLESRPTKRRMGEYCFVIDLEGHVDDEVIADCLRDLHAHLPEVRFLGSYPAAGEAGEALRRDAEQSWKDADAWVRDLKAKVGRGFWQTY